MIFALDLRLDRVSGDVIVSEGHQEVVVDVSRPVQRGSWRRPLLQQCPAAACARCVSAERCCSRSRCSRNHHVLPAHAIPQVTKVKLEQKQREGIAEARSGRRGPVRAAANDVAGTECGAHGALHDTSAWASLFGVTCLHLSFNPL